MGEFFNALCVDWWVFCGIALLLVVIGMHMNGLFGHSTT